MKNSNVKEKEDHGLSQAKAQLESIKEMVGQLNKARVQMEESQTNRTQRLFEEAEEAIQGDALSVEVRSGWHNVGDEPAVNEEFNILLCTGGPAVRIVGTLSDHAEPETARLEYQDWGTPWTGYRLTTEEEATVIAYAQCFYFGE